MSPKLGRAVTFSQLATVLLMFVVIGVAISIGIYMQNQIAETSFPTTTVTNESFAPDSNTSCTHLYYPYIKSVIAVYNNTWNNETIPATNYTVTTDCIVCCQQNETYPTQGGAYTKYITYVTWDTTTDKSLLIVKNSTSGLSTLSSWLPTIGVVVAAGVILALLIPSLGIGGRREGGI